MDRRTFFRKTALVSGSAFILAALPGCGAEVGPIVQQVWKPITEWLVELAKNVGSRVIGDQIEKWLTSDDSAARAAREPVNAMAEHGFRNLNAPVYITANNIVFFSVGHIDGFNACAPFIIDNSPHLLEGPALMGLTFMSNDIANQKKLEPTGIANVLLPTGRVESNGWDFKFDANGQARFPTAAGFMDMQYENIRPNEGKVRLVSSRFDGSGLANADYTLNYV